MEKNNLIRFVESLVLLPAMTLSLGSAHNVEIPKNGLAPQINITVKGMLAFNQADPEAESLKAKAEAIDAYFKAHDMPLEGTGMKMAEEALKNGLDWRLLPAIAVRESTGGKHECKKVKNSAFGWGSCKINFKSHEEAIEVIAKNLGGNNPNTAYHYDSKDTKGILDAYNPPSIVPKYADQVMKIMDDIGNPDTTQASSIASA